MGIFTRAARACGFIDEVLEAFEHLDELCDNNEDTREYDDWLWENYPDEFQRVNDYVDGWNDAKCRR